MRRSHPDSATARALLRARLATWPFVGDGFVWNRETVIGADPAVAPPAWGCEPRIQCQFGHWPLYNPLAPLRWSDDDGGGDGGGAAAAAPPRPPTVIVPETPDRSGVKAHCDPLCAPAFSLQLEGRKQWLLKVRRRRVRSRGSMRWGAPPS